MRKLFVVICIFLFAPFAFGQVFVNGAPTSPLPIPAVVGGILTFNKTVVGHNWGDGKITWDSNYRLFSLGYSGNPADAIVAVGQVTVGGNREFPFAVFKGSGMTFSDGLSNYDVGFSRISAGLFRINIGADSDKFGSLELGNVTLTGLESSTISSVTPRGTEGSTTYGYKSVAKMGDGSTAAASIEVQTVLGNATLTETNYNEIEIGFVVGATSYDVYRTTSNGTPSSTGKIITSATSSPQNDTGLVASGSAPTENTTGKIVASSYGSGSNTGMVTVITVRDSGGTADCTITVTGGIITATTCTHT